MVIHTTGQKKINSWGKLYASTLRAKKNWRFRQKNDWGRERDKKRGGEDERGKKTGIQNGRLLHRMQGEWLESERRPRASPSRVANTEYRPCVRSRQKKLKKKCHPILRDKKNSAKLHPTDKSRRKAARIYNSRSISWRAYAKTINQKISGSRNAITEMQRKKENFTCGQLGQSAQQRGK